MSKETPDLPAERRERHGTRYAQRLRKAGRLPAVVYGHGADPVSISVDAKETLAHLQTGNHVFNLAINGGASETCLVKDLQFGFMGDDVIHVDFSRVNLDEKVKVLLHLDFHGTPEAGQKGGAIVVHDLAEIEIECAVRDIPDNLRVDLEEFDEVVHVSDLKLPDGLVATTPGNTLVLHVQAPVGEDDEDDTAVSAAAETPEG